MDDAHTATPSPAYCAFRAAVVAAFMSHLIHDPLKTSGFEVIDRACQATERFLIFLETRGSTLRDITPTIVSDWCESIATPHLRRQREAGIRLFIDFLVFVGYYEASPLPPIAPAVRKKRTSSATCTPLSDEEMRILLAPPPNPDRDTDRTHFMLLLFVVSGLSGTELTELTVDMLDLPQEKLTYRTRRSVGWCCIEGVVHTVAARYLRHVRPRFTCSGTGPRFLFLAVRKPEVPICYGSLCCMVAAYGKARRIPGLTLTRFMATLELPDWEGFVMNPP